MTSKLKALGLALLSVFALGAVAASASAETLDHFTSKSLNGKTILTGEQEGTEAENVFGIKAVAALGVHCKDSSVTFGGTVASPGVTEITVHPTLRECTSNLGAATVNTEKCDFIFTGTTDKYVNTSGTEEGKGATVHIECTTGGAIALSTGGCTLSFASESGGKPVNQNLLGVRYTNVGSGNTADITMDVTFDKIHYTTNGAFACKLVGIPVTGADGFLTAKVTFKGFEDNEPTGPTPHQHVFPKEGPQVGIEVS